MMVHSWMLFCTLFGILADAHVGILVDAHVGIWWIHFIDDILAHCWHMGVVHGGQILVHDLLGGYIFHDSLFH
jgi:hypothetical protein